MFNFSITGSGSPDDTGVLGTGELWQRNAQEVLLEEEETGVDILFVDEEQRKTARQGRVFKNREGKEIGSRRDVTCSGKNTRTRGSAMAHGSRIKIVPSSSNVAKRIV